MSPRKLFLSEGVVGGHLSKQNPYAQSDYWKSYVKNGNIDYLGRVRNFKYFKNKEYINYSFAKFMHTRYPDWFKNHGDKYRMTFTNFEAGFKGFAKFDRGLPEVAISRLKVATQWAVRHWRPFCSGSEESTLEEVKIQADKQSSVGWPESDTFKNSAKWMENSECDYIVNKVYQDASEMSPPYTPVATGAEKFELRDYEKLKENKIRFFTAMPKTLTLNMNRMFLKMNEKFYDSANKTWSFVGCSPYNGGFDCLHNRLDKHENGYACDESGYDTSLFPELMYSVMEWRWQMLSEDIKTPENRQRLENYYHWLVHTVIVLENGELVMKHTGNPSGSSNTIVDNTVALFILLTYAWLTLSPPDYKQYDLFMDHVEAALNGDDNTYTVSNEVNGWFNAKMISEVWTQLGIVTTSDDFNPRRVKDLDFLSQKFVYMHGKYLPCPETDRVLCSLLYGSSVQDVRWHYLRACALRIVSWANLECRKIISQYIELLDKEFRKDLVGIINGISMKEIYGVWKDDVWCRLLYTGEQTGPGPEVNLTLCEKIFENFIHDPQIFPFIKWLSNK